MLETVKAETNPNWVKTIAGTLLPYYTNRRRDNLVFALSGCLQKNHVPEPLISEIVECIVFGTNGEVLRARLRVAKGTCTEDPNSDQVSI